MVPTTPRRHDDSELAQTPAEANEPTDELRTQSAPKLPEYLDQDCRPPTVVEQHDSPTELIEAVQQQRLPSSRKPGARGRQGRTNSPR